MGGLSIRQRLTVWTGAGMAAILVGLGLAAYWLTGQALMERIDAALDFEFQETAERMRNGSADELAELPEAFQQTYLLRVMGPDGRVRMQSRALKRVAMPPPRPGPGDSAPVARTLPLGKLGPHRVISGAIGDHQQFRVLQIATSLRDYHREMAEVRAVLLTILPAGLLLALGAGYALAGRALAPVQRITEAARRISVQNLHERIVVDHPGDELGRLADTLNAMFDRLDQSFAAMRRFTADASHELKTPIAALRTEAEVALQSTRSAEHLAEVLRSVVEEADRLARLADRLLLLSREDAGVDAESRRPTRLDDLIRSVAEYARAPVERAGLTLRLEDLPAVTVAADPDRLRQVFDNLLDNAIKYNQSGGSIVVRGHRAGDLAVVEVADTGVGIPTPELPRIFDRFYRVDASRSRRTGGAGLGLSIVHALVEGHDGRVEVQSAPGGGSTFRVVLPIMSSP